MNVSKKFITLQTNGTSNIPIRRQLSKGSISPTAKTQTQLEDEINKWRYKFEELDQKRKNLLVDNEKNKRSYNELEKKYNNLHAKNEEMEEELFEKNENITKLTLVSKSLFKDYDTLKNKYDVETDALHRAMNDATHWYRENKKLRRQTQLFDSSTGNVYVGTADRTDANNHHPGSRSHSSNSSSDGDSSCETGSSSDLDNLRETVRTLSTEVAHLQTELNSAKLTEFEAMEMNSNLSQEVDALKKTIDTIEIELIENKEQNSQLLRISDMLRNQIKELSQSEQTQREAAVLSRQEANNYKTERNVLKHQSIVIMQGLDGENGFDNLILLNDIETLKSTIEMERNQHNEELNNLQENIDDISSNSHIEILEERLKLVESELAHALNRAEKAENALMVIPAPAAVPPSSAPPPPPPPPPPSFIINGQMPPAVPLRTRKNATALAVIGGAEIIANNESPEGDVGTDATGIKKIVPIGTPGVTHDIINQIKGGLFTLKKAKNKDASVPKSTRETPKAMNEMLNILGSLKQTKRKSMVFSKSTTLADVHV